MESQSLTVDIGRALQIEGWFSPEECLWLAEQAQKAKCIVELGSFLGRSTRAMADNTHGIILAVDWWFGPIDVEVLGREHLFEQFSTNLHDRIASKVVTPWKVNLYDVTPQMITDQLNGEEPDLLFIDAEHSYKAVKHDLETWLPFVKSGGLVCGHDFDFNYAGLLRAVLEMIPDPQAVPGTSLWMWTKP